MDSSNSELHSFIGNSPDFQLSAWVRKRNEKNEVPEISSKNIDIIKEQLPKYTPGEKQTILLQALARKIQYPGHKVCVRILSDVTLCWASSEIEFGFYLQALKDRNLIRFEVIATKMDIWIEAKGWDYLDSYSKNIEKKTQVFVAMSFSDKMTSVWAKAISPAIKKAGYQPYRVDDKPHNERIDVKIMSEIKNSRFIVADFTENKHGVYFEAGYALGLNIPVIWCVNKEYKEENEMHFDTRQYNHILWKNEKDLEEKLFYFIDVIIGKLNKERAGNTGSIR